MEVSIKPGHWPNIREMQDTIRRSGYTPILDEVEIRLSGKVVRHGKGLAIEVHGLKAPVRVPVVSNAEHADAAVHLERHVGERVEVEARWKGDPRKPKDVGSLGVITIRCTDSPDHD
jgi:hypothetical protein